MKLEAVRWTRGAIALALLLLYSAGTFVAVGYRGRGSLSPGTGGKMTRRVLVALLLVSLVAVTGPSGWAASESEKRIFNGPSKTSFGGLELVLGQGASAEAA